MGCLQSSGLLRSSRNRNRLTSGRNTTATNERVDETNPQNRQERNAAEEERAAIIDLQNRLENTEIRARRFTLAELEAATGKFRARNMLGEGGFGKVYKGRLADPDQIVAIKKMNSEGDETSQGIREFLNEVITLNKFDHPNLVRLIGYCAEGNDRLLVYEYMALGSLDKHLYGEHASSKHLDWNVRMEIAAGIASGLEYLHNHFNPSIIYRDLKTANVLLDENFHVKLSDFGFAREGPEGGRSHVSTRILGTYGYCAPEYAMTGFLSVKSDIYSFGVVLLELITGRKAIDTTKPDEEKNLVTWARSYLKDIKSIPNLADPALGGQFEARQVVQAFSIVARCVDYTQLERPLVADVLAAVRYVASNKYVPENQPVRRGPHGEGPSGVNKDDKDEG